MSIGTKGGLQRPVTQTRRSFLATLSLAGATGLLGAPSVLAAEGVLETPTVRLQKISSQGGICAAPVRIVGELLRAEGFTDVRCRGIAASRGLQGHHLCRYAGGHP